MIISESIDKQKIWDLLSEVLDPEVPVLNVVELGIVRDVIIQGNRIEIVITPTYSGCPAMKVIEDDILGTLKSGGFSEIKIRTIISPAWTTDWIKEEAKEKLRIYGIAPPEKSTADKSSITGKPKNLSCPRCGSKQVDMISQFGSTACKALYRCISCREPFDYFKCL